MPTIASLEFITLHVRIQKVLSEGVQFFDYVFLVDKGREDPPNSTISGPSVARQRNANKMAFHWRADDGPTLNAGLADL